MMYGSWSVAMFYSFESLKHYYFSPKPIDPLKMDTDSSTGVVWVAIMVVVGFFWVVLYRLQI